jgi:hypothetical protein
MVEVEDVPELHETTLEKSFVATNTVTTSKRP